MTSHGLVLGFVGLSALVAVAGCSSEVPANDEMQASVEESDIEPATNNYMKCTGATDATQHTATLLFTYALGGQFTFPAGTACTNVKNALDTLRGAIESGEVTSISKVSYLSICGRNTTQWNLSDRRAVLKGVGDALEANVQPCFGDGVLAFLLPVAQTTSWGSTLKMDPEPATLTADLSSTQGASAAAYWQQTLEPTTAKKWSSTYTACGTAVAGGEPCSTTALASGQNTDRLIQKTGTSCRCL